MLQQNNPIPTRPPGTQLKARAAELKAQLLKGKEARAGSATPPVPTSGVVARQNVPVDASSSLHGSPQTPIAATENHEQELSDLISQYSDSKPTANASTKQKDQKSETTANLQQASTIPSPSAKSQEPSLESPTKVPKPSPNAISAVHSMVKANQSRHPSNGSISEGEILEDTPKMPTPPTEPKQRQSTSKPVTTDDELTRTLGYRPTKTSYGRGPRDESPPRRPPPSNPRGHSQRSYDDRRDEPQPLPERRGLYQPDHKPERKPTSEFEKEPYQRRSSRDESHHRTDSNSVQKREGTNKAAEIPDSFTLADLLARDEDLREWLDITGYHNAPYRDKILSRRRALAKLDAERKRLLADIEADERSGLPPTSGPQTPASSMLPPPIPNKVGPKTESTLSPMETTDNSKRDRVVSNKRAHSDVDDGRDRSPSGKTARTDDRGPRIKEEEDYDHRRPRSSGFGAHRWSSTDHRDERGSPRHRYDEDRNLRGDRGHSRDRDISPGRRAYESRPPPRSGNFGADDTHYRDEYQDRDRRPFVSVGGYRGKAYDPNYRGRGRGRGRGDFQSHQQHEAKNELAFGSRIANGRPYRDPRGFDRGGKGGR
jgi:YTH domain-containing protein 1